MILLECLIWNITKNVTGCQFHTLCLFAFTQTAGLQWNINKCQLPSSSLSCNWFRLLWHIQTVNTFWNEIHEISIQHYLWSQPYCCIANESIKYPWKCGWTIRLIFIEKHEYLWNNISMAQSNKNSKLYKSRHFDVNICNNKG